ncbi:hypothetical protein CALCODRAFT_360487 [Calocera cornea HHB12733]|uniref:Uncharacterized protein n=1 Tax=Calocera cornea HHB12733 TaxID=1353952 RepID=A0A165EML6_9BASI|nr:hypothetical protein CALCODRAFT_360487 [Calocera cornea HHB12733]
MPDDPPPAPGDSPFPTLFPLPLPPPPSPPTPNHHIPARTDERCLTYCTQASNARVFQSPPTCHTLCWRRIWAYERSLIQAASTRAPLALTVPAPVQVGRGEEARELHSRFGRERERLQAMARAEQLASVPGKEAQQGERAARRARRSVGTPTTPSSSPWSTSRPPSAPPSPAPSRASRRPSARH